ncbi:hypothetical protein HY11_17380 [Hyphomonas pacifica]|nr:hypothetical protein HY11_17380 [Hyphomonas pacifica]
MARAGAQAFGSCFIRVSDALCAHPGRRPGAASEKSGGRMETVRAKGAVEWLMLCRGFRRPEPLQEKTLHGSLWGRDAVGNHWEKIGGPSENREA